MFWVLGFGLRVWGKHVCMYIYIHVTREGDSTDTIFRRSAGESVCLRFESISGSFSVSCLTSLGREI